MIENGIIYVTKNLMNNKIYVGIHTKNNPNYLGSGEYLRNAIKKYGKENFSRATIDEFDELEIGLAKERYWIRELNAKWPLGYNLNDGGEGQFNPCEELRAKMGLAQKGKKGYWLGKKLSDTTKLKMSEISRKRIAENGHPMLGRKQSPESRAKMSKSKKELYLKKPELRERLASLRAGKKPWNTGKKMSEELRNKLSLVHVGHKDSKETKRNKSISATKAWAVRKNGRGGVLLSTVPN